LLRTAVEAARRAGQLIAERYPTQRYFHLALHPWDAAAAILLITEAGGRCTTLAGRPYDVGSPDCAATNGRVHEALLEALREPR
jgi:myo-inositol-1(or 4)-monophosphatase